MRSLSKQRRTRFRWLDALRVAVLAALTVGLTSALAWADAGSQRVTATWVLAQQSPQDGGTTTTTPAGAQGFFWEYVLIFLLIGAALFAICRSSQRV